MRTRWSQLALGLRETATHLRVEAGTEPGDGSVPAILSRACIATRLLVARSEQEGLSGFSNWLANLAELLAGLERRPDLVTKGHPVLSDLVSWQESLLSSLDVGIALAAAVELREIASLQDRFTVVWRDLLSCDNENSATTTVLLLVSSSLRASELNHRVQSAGFSVAVCTNPTEACSFLAQAPEAIAVLCDEVEPTRNLSKLRQMMQGKLPQPQSRLILVTGSRRPEMARRACHLGAHGVWLPPFRADDLRDLCF